MSSLAIIPQRFGSNAFNGLCAYHFKKGKDMSMLVVSGVMIGYICSAVTEFVVTFADDSRHSKPA